MAKARKITPYKKRQVPFSMAIGNELMHECFHKHSTWEQQERNETITQMKNVRREARVRIDVKWHEKNISLPPMTT